MTKKIWITLVLIAAIILAGFAIYGPKNTPVIKPSTYAEGTSERVAEDFVKTHSVEGIEFTLTKGFDNGTFVKFYVVPTGKYAESMDEARIFLKKNATGYEVIGFGTAFPELEEKYPELKGQI
jgi:hypothetical protein